MIKNIKTVIVIPVLCVMSLMIWILLAVIEVAHYVTELLEYASDKLFGWAQKR